MRIIRQDIDRPNDTIGTKTGKLIADLENVVELNVVGDINIE